MDANPVRQRAELTHKHNRDSGRHGWLRLTPAYSVKLVSNILDHFDAHVSVLDPFSGTGTTALAAAERGHTGLGIDINPFLVWLGNTKLATYTRADIAAAARAVTEILAHRNATPVSPPPIHNIERWWHPEILAFLCNLRGQMQAKARKHSKVGNLLDVMFCQTLIRLSNASFNHQSMSFAGERAEHHHAPEARIECFQNSAEKVLASLAPNPSGQGKVILGDSRAAPSDETYDLLITSPPYPNRISYVRELRPYMYWLGYLEEAREAGELDWKAIGGTWGVATSRLAEWTPEGGVFVPNSLRGAIARIRESDGTNGRLLSVYVQKYFHDMWLHFCAVKGCLKAGAKVVYIVGNSTFYGVPVPAEQIYAEMLDLAGFVNVHVETIRKRNSKKELFEYAVEADFAAANPLGRVASLPQHHTVQLGFFADSLTNP